MSKGKVVILPVVRTERNSVDLACQHLQHPNHYNVVALRWARLKRAFQQLDTILANGLPSRQR
jgi:hypothetical protein